MISLESVVRTYGYWALLVGTFLEGETILIIGGLLAHLGYLKLPTVMFMAFVGSFSGDQFYFFLGRQRGPDLLVKYPKWQNRFYKVHQLTERYHDLIMLGFRFVYGMRIMTPFVLAMNKKIKTSRFVILNAVGAIIWSVVVAGGGYLSGYALEIVLRDVKRYEIGIIGIMLTLGIMFWLIHKYRENRENKKQ